MPRPKSQSSLRAPLNEMLGAQANVRILRALALAGTPLGAGELSQRSQLGRTGVYPVLTTLERIGIIEFVGAGSTRQIRLRKAHPLALPVANLFRAEAQRIESLVAALRKMFAKIEKLIVSAWLNDDQDSATEDELDMMTCYVVAELRSLPMVVDRVEENLPDIERTFQVQVEVVPLSRSEVFSRLRKESLDEVLLLAGVPPKALVAQESLGGGRNQIVHGYHDVRAQRLAEAIAAKLRRDPSIVRLVRKNIEGRLEHASEQERRELREWLRIISTMSPAKLRRFLVDGSQRAVRLRQSLPALGLLTAKEREEIMGSQTEKEALGKGRSQ